MQIIVGMF